MDIIIGFASLGLLVLLNISAAFYNYGRLSKAVETLDKRVCSLELNYRSNHKEETREISELTGRVLVLEVKDVIEKPKKK